MIDGLEATVRFYKMISSGDVFIKNPFNTLMIIFLLFDTVHLFKNIYCNFLKYGIFVCPSFEEDGQLTAKFAHIVQLYNIELTTPVKRAHKLVEKMLHPSSIEKNNVMLADACFHDSTINALRYYAVHGYPEFEETAKVLRIIRDWFNRVNVKSKFSGQRTRDPHQTKIDVETVESATAYLAKFKDWVTKWKSSEEPGLSRQTFSALLQTSNGFLQMIPYLLNGKGLQYVLFGFIQSDPVEGRFRWYRQLCGANYLNSVLQFLQAEKSLRIRALVTAGFDMASIKDIFAGIEEKISKERDNDVEVLMESLYSLNFETEVDAENKSIVYNYAGYISRNILRPKKITCSDCIEMIWAIAPIVLVLYERGSGATMLKLVNRILWKL